MSKLGKLLVAVVFVCLGTAYVSASPMTGKYFDRAIFVVFENTNYSDAIKQSFFKQLAVIVALISLIFQL